MAARATKRAFSPAILALIAVPLLFHFAIVTTRHISPHAGLNLATAFRFSVVTAAAIGHWAIYSGLLLTFAMTLRPGHEALITTMTRRMHGHLSPEVAAYTRHVTIAWCCFFAAQLTTSVALFVFAPLVVWSFFVNILDIPLVAAMFAGEFLVRHIRLENPPRESLAVLCRMIADIRKPQEAAAGPQP